MKKRNALRRQFYGLPNATTISKESYLFQYYRGDFFTIFITHPINLPLHQHLKNAHLDPGQPVRLLYADEFIFEIFVEHDITEDYQVICPC